jgi:hypothetical protein
MEADLTLSSGVERGAEHLARSVGRPAPGVGALSLNEKVIVICSDPRPPSAGQGGRLGAILKDRASMSR